jgi:hypothetical protein
MVSESRDRRGIAPPPVHREKREAEQTHSMDIVIVLHDFQQTHIPFTVLGISPTLVWRSRETRCRTPRARAALHATRAEGNIPRCKVYMTAASATIAGDCECERLDVTLALNRCSGWGGNRLNSASSLMFHCRRALVTPSRSKFEGSQNAPGRTVSLLHVTRDLGLHFPK